MTDESCATVYGYASGEISKEAQEDTEEIEVVLADRNEVKRILKEERCGNHVCIYADALSQDKNHLHSSKTEARLHIIPVKISDCSRNILMPKGIKKHHKNYKITKERVDKALNDHVIF